MPFGRIHVWTREEAKAEVERLDSQIVALENRRDYIRDEFIRCETCGGKMSGPPCHGIKPIEP